MEWIAPGDEAMKPRTGRLSELSEQAANNDGSEVVPTGRPSLEHHTSKVKRPLEPGLTPDTRQPSERLLPIYQYK